MAARIMLSSVTKDEIPLGDTSMLKAFWFEAETAAERLQAGGEPLKADSRISFTAARSEVQRHLIGKYGFEVYNFQNTPTDSGAPEEITIQEVYRSHMVIGLFGSQTGWKVPDQDPLTPTLREWRAALERPLKFKLFAFKGSLGFPKPPLLEKLVRDITDYKKGLIYTEFSSAVELFALVDASVRDYVNRAVVRYAQDYVARQPNSETEKWLLLPYRTRVEEMNSALAFTADDLGIKAGRLTLGSASQPIELHCVPDNFSIPESKKFAAYIFDDEVSSADPKEPGKLHIVASFGSVTDLQVRRHLGNFEAAEVYSAPWGFYAAVPATGVQCVYLPKCINYLIWSDPSTSARRWCCFCCCLCFCCSRIGPAAAGAGFVDD
jgi:hypothetical protein